MARNGSGVFSKPVGTTAVSGTTIDSVAFNTLADDIAADLNLPRPVVAGGTGSATAAAARVSLGVAIGSDVQGFDAGLASIAGLTTAADKGVYTTGADTYATFALGALSRTFLANTTTAGFRSTLELGTAATRAAEDTLTDGSALPDGAAVKAYVDSQPLASQYSSAETAIALGTKQSFSHGLGAVPKAFEVFIVCKTADAPYAVGEYVRLPSSYSASGANANGDISVSTTSVIVRTTGGIRLTNDAGSFITITAANWRFVVRAWV